MVKCRCDSGACTAKGTCPCAKAESQCTAACHMGKPWESVPCLNTEAGLKIKPMKPADLRKGLCDAGLSPIGDKGELMKRLAVYYSSLVGSKAENGSEETEGGEEGGGGKSDGLMDAILANEGDYVFILSLSGKMVKKTSSKAELRRAYLMLSTKVHPDKNFNSPLSKKAFQAVLESFERLANPEKFEDEEEDDDGKPPKKRKKTDRFTRDNSGCHITQIRCPRCRDRWNCNDLGLEESSYNFLMQGIKQYLCGGCFAQFGCMTAIHKCPHCKKGFEYDPDDYHRKITCGNERCNKTFGFWMFKVSERREVEIRREVKVENEALSKKRSQQRRRAARADKRTGDVSNEQRVQEQLFLLKLIDECPRCGWEMERGMHIEDAKQHLDGCNDEKVIKAYQKTMESKKSKADKKVQLQENQEDVMAFKTWEHNGRQVGQLWMLSETTLKKECKKFNLDQDGKKHELIIRLGRVIRERERKMITAGPAAGGAGMYDVTKITDVDDEDMPQNMHTMDREDLQCVAASYGLDFDHGKDVKADLLLKLEKARDTGRGLLMIEAGAENTDKYPDYEDKSDDPDFEDSDDD